MVKGRLRKHYIAKYHVWCIDWCLFLSVFDTYLPLLVLKIALFYSELSCHFVSYRPGYHVHFYLVVSKMSLVLPWQPPADNNVCFCLVKEYYLYICWKIKLLLLREYHKLKLSKIWPVKKYNSNISSVTNQAVSGLHEIKSSHLIENEGYIYLILCKMSELFDLIFSFIINVIRFIPRVCFLVIRAVLVAGVVY